MKNILLILAINFLFGQQVQIENNHTKDHTVSPRSDIANNPKFQALYQEKIDYYKKYGNPKYIPTFSNSSSSGIDCEYYTVEMCDSYGDGWNGNTLTIGSETFYGPPDISGDGEGNCIEECYDLSGVLGVLITCDGGQFQYEVAWSIFDANGTIMLSGGAPYSAPLCTYNCEALGSNCVETNVENQFECCPSDHFWLDCDGVCYHESFLAAYLGNEVCNAGKDEIAPNLYCSDHDYDNGDCESTGNCSDAGGNSDWIADGYCDSGNNNSSCEWDGGDCCGSTCEEALYDCTSSITGACANTCLDPDANDDCCDNSSCDFFPYSCETDGLFTCWDGSCAESGNLCPDCGVGYIASCDGNGSCCPLNMLGCDSGQCDLTCYEEECMTGPDLVVDQNTLENSIYTDTQMIYDGDCFIEEGCVTGFGLRDIVRFSTEVGNIGSEDFYIGYQSEQNGSFNWADCHGHYHFEQYAEYALLSIDGDGTSNDCTLSDMQIGHKNGWCVMDLSDYTNDGQCDQKYGCTQMGISAGCSDIYSSALECQWLDVTDIPNGDYVLQVTTNQNFNFDLMYELDYSNNSAQVGITLSGTDGNRGVVVNQNFDVSLCEEFECDEPIDCAGECGGSAQEDECGICDGNGMDVCWNGSNTCDIATCPPNPNEVEYSDIQEIFTNNCTSCHAGTTPSYELNLESYCNLMVGSAEGSVITPGDHTTSVLWQSVDESCAENEDIPFCMPFTSSLDPVDIELIATWIDKGAEDDGSTGSSTADACGVCGGDGTSCQDCNGEPNGDAMPDCAGVCDGNAAYDECGTCVPEGGTPCAIEAEYNIESAFPNLSFTSPVGIHHADDATARLFVIEQIGRIKSFTNNPTTSSTNTFLDITNIVEYGGEEGLLGFAFHPNFSENGYFYVNYTDYSPRRNVIARYSVSDGNPNQADANSSLIMLEVNQPFSNHNGGQMSFGPDGYLYVSFGDGGSGGDPYGHGQNLSTLLGSIIRIDVDNPSAGLNYSIPSDNPFITTENAADEIYAYGLRNMWKFSFDPVTDLLWGGDVGQNAWEEIDIINSGLNYGWNTMEGNHCYSSSSCSSDGLELPVFEYSLAGSNCAITGGYVYRGTSMPSLYGKYIYGDYCSGDIWAFSDNVSNTNRDCTDFDDGDGGIWYDSDGPVYDCSWYETYGCPDYGDLYENFGMIAQEACCACGGGSNGGADDDDIAYELVNTNKYITSFGVDQYNELLFCSPDGHIYKLISDEQPTFMVGDINADYLINVSDVIMLVDFIMNDSSAPNAGQFYRSDLSDDGLLNVADVVMLVQIIMGDNLSRGESASKATIYYGNESVYYSSDGIIAGIQLSVKGDYKITKTTMPAGWEIANDEKTIIMYSLDGSHLEDEVLFEYDGDIVIESGIATDWYGSEILISRHHIPKSFSLDRAYPNPFNPTTTLSFAIPVDSEVSISVYNLQGKEVSHLISGNMEAGYHSVVWDANSYSSGVYFVKMVSGEFINTQKLMLIK